MIGRARKGRVLGLLRRWRRDEGGSVLVVSAVCLVLALAGGALAVDLGNLYLAQRQLQGGADLAAIAAMRAPSRADQAVRATVLGNGLPAATRATLEWGRYDPTRAVAARFAAGAATPANAARVTLRRSVDLFLARAFYPAGRVDISAAGVASLDGTATISIGSRLASLNGGILNAMLSALTGSTISLQLADYRALADAKVDLLSTLSALNTNLNLRAGTYDEILKSSVSVGDLAKALVSANPGLGVGAASALSLLGWQAGAGAAVRLADAIDLGPLGGLAVGGGSNLVSLGALDLLRESLAASDGTHQLALDLGAGIPGLAAAKATLSVGERPKWLSTGAVGTTVRTAQMRLKLDVTVGGTQGALVGVGLHLPVYVEVAAAEARITALDCAAAGGTLSLAAHTGVVEGWIAAVDPARMPLFTATPPTPPARLAEVSLLAGAARVGIDAYAHAVLGNPADQAVGFTAADAAAGTVRTIRANGLVGSLLASLLGNLRLTPTLTILGLDPLGLIAKAAQPLVQPLLQLVGTTLAAAVSPVDALVDNLLAALGVGLGEADIRLVSLSCGQARLVM